MEKSALKRISVNFISLFLCTLVFAAPLISHAALPGIKCGVTGAGTDCLIPCNGVDPATMKEDCDFKSLLQLVSNVMYYLIYISIPIAAVAFAYSGWLFMTAGGSGSNVSRARGIFTKVGTGLIVILAAWLIVKTIVDVLLDPQYSPLG